MSSVTNQAKEGGAAARATPDLGERSRIPAKLVILASVAVASALVCGVALVRGWVTVATFEGWLRQAEGPSAMAIYVGGAVLVQLLWVPRMWSLIVAGLFFGSVLGVVLSVVADMLSATLVYALARFAGRAYVEMLLARHPRAQALVDVLVRRQGVMTVFVLRALPVHYTASSYAGGLAGVPWGTYLLGTFLGILPGTLVFTLVGDQVRDPTSPWFWVSVAVMLAVVIIGLVLARRFWMSMKRL